MLRTEDLKWLAGFFEGEASFGNVSRRPSARIQVPQVQLWPLEECQRLLGGTIAWRKNKTLGINIWHVNGTLAVGLMMTLYRFMSPDRKLQIKKALIRWKAGQVFNRYKISCPKGHPYVRRWIRTRGHYQRVCVVCPRERYWRDGRIRKRKTSVRVDG